MIRMLAVVVGTLLSLTLGSAPAVAEEDGASSPTTRAHAFASKWFDHVSDEDWTWVRRHTNTTNLPMKRVKKLAGTEIEVDGCYRRPDAGGFPTKPHLRYCFAASAEWQIILRDSGRLRMKDVVWYR